jgi:hypothetical protein
MPQPDAFKVIELINLQNNVAVAPTEFDNFRIGLQTNRTLKKCSISKKGEIIQTCTTNDHRCANVSNDDNTGTCQFVLKTLKESGNLFSIFTPS